MSAGPQITRSQERALTAFELEVEAVWLKLAKRRTPVEVWLTPNWILATRYHPMSQQVGTYDADIDLRAFRDDCFFVLEQARAKR